MDQPLKPKPTPKSERPYLKLSDKQKESLVKDAVEHLRIVKAFKLFADIHGRDKPN